MQTFIFLCKFTADGIKGIKERPQRSGARGSLKR
jgi:uncharacterized protein with GYD domain